MSKKALLIVNPRAGKNKKLEKITDTIIKEFAISGSEVELIYTTCKGDATNIAINNTGKYDFYLCCGGDGTLSETIAGVMKAPLKTPIGYIPTGSTNDMAKTLSLPRGVKAATNACVRGVPTIHDVGVFNEEYYFTYIASFGAFTEVSYSTSQKLKNNFGHFAYIIGGVKQLTKLKSYNVTVRSDDFEVTEDILLGSMSNTLSVAGMFSFNKDEVSLCDGKFEIMLVRKPTGPLSLGKAVHGVLHRKYNDNYITLIHSDHAEFEFNGDIPDWSLDGECCKGQRKIEVRAIEGAIQIIR